MLRAIRPIRILLAFAATVAALSCGGPQIAKPFAGKRVCVVLSVGELYGIAHAGALRQLVRRGVRPACVVGNSMGAVVGSLYAAKPSEDPAARMRLLLQGYVAQSEREFADHKFKYLAAEAVKRLTDGAIDLGAFKRLDHGRFVRVLNEALGGAQFGQLALPFATSHQARDGAGLAVVPVTSGNVADAVGASAANPFIFDDIDLKTAQRIDPGADRLSAVPVSEACRLFADAAIIAVNVSGQPMEMAAGLQCPVYEIRVARRPNLDRNAAAAGGAEFDALVQDGERAAQAALAGLL